MAPVKPQTALSSPADEFETTTEDRQLRALVLERIRKAGAITFAEFMTLALYHPRWGYYATSREKLGRGGDYVTSPEVGPLFGAATGRQLAEMWERLGRGPFAAVEFGPGSGRLCRDILRWAARTRPDFLGALEYRLVETSPALRRQQRAVVSEAGPSSRRARWCRQEAALAPRSLRGCILSNEFLDALPVHRVTVRDGVLTEVFVTAEGETLCEQLGEPSTPALDAYFQRLGLLPGEGCRAEVNLAAAEWMARAAEALEWGFLLTLDYGYEAADLYAPWRRQGTLTAFYRHAPATDPYRRLGRQDLTAHVDFTTLARVGEEHGLTTLGSTTQARFLAALGIADALQPGPGGDLAGLPLEEHLARRRAVLELLDPAGLGRIRVLAQGRGVSGAPLRGLAHGAEEGAHAGSRRAGP